jgi:hypothetical protein
MTRHWILQGNPDLYDLDGALAELDEISWRVHQHTAEIRRGDLVLIWRSGSEAGVVAIGRVLDDPSLSAQPEREHRFELAGEAAEATRCPIAVRAVDWIPKARVQALPEMADHLIVTAPRATVYPLDEAQWAALTAGLPDPPDAPYMVPSDAYPHPFAWEQRRKSVYPMPGSYSGYLDSLRAILGFARTEMPAPERLVGWLREHFGLGEVGARNRVGFLRRAGLLREEGGVVRVSDTGLRWLEQGDHAALIAEVHARIQFIGEMLDATTQPRSAAELLDLANEQFQMDWKTDAQISRRRGWLQSAGLLVVDAEGRLHTTEAGVALASKLQLHHPTPTSGPIVEPAPPVQPPPEPPPPVAKRQVDVDADELTGRLVDAARNNTRPDELEYAVRDAFRFLGFRAERIAGSGNTDVVVDADLGVGASYRVNIDTKSTGTGVVTDSQINWDSLADHQERNRADYVAVVGVGFAGGNVQSRAETRGFKLVTVSELAGLCRQHAQTPLGVDDYRILFDAEGTT